MNIRHLFISCISVAVAATTACAGVQSSLAPAGDAATRIARLYWWMAGGAAVVWVGMLLLVTYYARPHAGRPSPRRDRWLILGAGVALPTVVVGGLLVFGLALLPDLLARAPAGSLVVEVEGEQWWWRVRYLRPGGAAVETANEVRLPVGAPVEFRLTSDNVIHSFWIPSLGGKMDMIPGRLTRLTLRPTQTGIFAGACAEYCGTSHALMRFDVDVMPQAAFDRWLTAQAAPAAEADDSLGRRGFELFHESGCGACHRVRGTDAIGRLGPDLTHVGSRRSLGAATLPLDRGTLARWLARPDAIKPAVHMPAFGMLAGDDIAALAAYLESLR